MKVLLSLVSPILLPAVALASEASEEPSWLEGVVPFAVLAVLLAILFPLVSKKKK